jgi:DNA-binding LacI/PurR family transcriptional regulator
VEEVAAGQGMLVVVATALDSPVRGSLMARRLVARGVDGLIALSIGPPPDVLGGEGPDRASGVFAASGLTAIGLLEGARAAGVRVPEDLALVGYPDVQAAPWVRPPLTMVAVPAREAGARAMDTLVRLIAAESIPGGEVVLEVELVIRDCGVHDLAS